MTQPNYNAYEQLSVVQKVQVNAAVLEQFRTNPAFVQRFRQSVDTNIRNDGLESFDARGGERAAQRVLDNVRDHIAENGLRFVQPVTDNIVNDTRDLAIQSGILRNIVSDMSMRSLAHGRSDPSHYRVIASQRDTYELNGRTYSQPVPAGPGQFNITNVNTFFNKVDAYDAVQRLPNGGLQIRLDPAAEVEVPAVPGNGGARGLA